MINELKQLIEDSEKILITSHISPDGDSVSSSLLLYAILRLNYPDKSVQVSMEEEPFGLSFLDNYKDIKFQPLQTALDAFGPDLVIILDSNSLSRITRSADKLQPYFDEHNFKVAIIDHHENSTSLQTDFHYNESSPAVTFDIYDIFIDRLGFKKPSGYAQTTLTGIYTDTGGFVHRNSNFKKVFDTVPKLIEDGADLEALVVSLSKISERGIAVLAELFSNLEYRHDFAYTFISDETTTEDNHEALVEASNAFRNNYLRSIEGRPWGFIVQRDVMVESGIYSVSMRAQTDTVDVSKIAQALGGGGHKPAAGAKFKASNAGEAVRLVLDAIEQSRPS